MKDALLEKLSSKKFAIVIFAIWALLDAGEFALAAGVACIYLICQTILDIRADATSAEAARSIMLTRDAIANAQPITLEHAPRPRSRRRSTT